MPEAAKSAGSVPDSWRVGFSFYVPRSTKASHHLFKSGDMENFRRALQSEADKGDLESQTVLGEVYLRAFRVERDIDRAESLLTAPVAAGLPHALYELGVLRLIQQRASEARSLMTESARKGFLPAIADLGRLSEYGIGGAAHAHSAIEFYQLAARRGHVWARVFLGEMIVRGSTAWWMTVFGRLMKGAGALLFYARTLQAWGTTERTHVFVTNTALRHIVAINRADGDARHRSGT